MLLLICLLDVAGAIAAASNLLAQSLSALHLQNVSLSVAANPAANPAANLAASPAANPSADAAMGMEMEMDTLTGTKFL